MTKYKISVDNIFVERDQGLRFVNFEGKLELQGTFIANGAAVIYPQNSASDSRANVQANQDETLLINLAITQVDVAPGTSIPIRAEIRELEFGAQGDDDSGSFDDVLILDGSSEIRKTLTVNISADNRKERGGVVKVTFIARLQP
jgi:hypothetical protein